MFVQTYEAKSTALNLQFNFTHITCTVNMDQPKKPSDRLRNIQRCDIESSGLHAWRVAVMRNKRSLTKWFSDAMYGGKRKALQAAIAFREKFLTETDGYDHQIWIRTALRCDNKSGISGVRRYVKIEQYNDSIYHHIFWRAYWSDENGYKRSRQFSVLRYGELEAKKLAIEERERQLARICAIKGTHWFPPQIQKCRKSKL